MRKNVPSDTHSIEVVVAAALKRKAVLWEILGLLVAIGFGIVALSAVTNAIITHNTELLAAKAIFASAAKPELASVDIQVVKTESVRDSIQLPGQVYPNSPVKKSR